MFFFHYDIMSLPEITLFPVRSFFGEMAILDDETPYEWMTNAPRIGPVIYPYISHMSLVFP
jgi:hypothetical protein